MREIKSEAAILVCNPFTMLGAVAYRILYLVTDTCTARHDFAFRFPIQCNVLEPPVTGDQYFTEDAPTEFESAERMGLS